MIFLGQLFKKEKKCEECGVSVAEILSYKDKKLCKKCFEKYTEIFEE
jgi:formylmethanofuran dehydrogenase subunit E